MQVSGYRYYSPGLGRWASRDPIGEMGGGGLYSFVSNGPATATDLLGMLLLIPQSDKEALADVDELRKLYSRGGSAMSEVHKDVYRAVVGNERALKRLAGEGAEFSVSQALAFGLRHGLGLGRTAGPIASNTAKVLRESYKLSKKLAFHFQLSNCRRDAQTIRGHINDERYSVPFPRGEESMHGTVKVLKTEAPNCQYYVECVINETAYWLPVPH